MAQDWYRYSELYDIYTKQKPDYVIPNNLISQLTVLLSYKFY